jgi:hypothetical protein
MREGLSKIVVPIAGEKCTKEPFILRRRYAQIDTGQRLLTGIKIQSPVDNFMRDHEIQSRYSVEHKEWSSSCHQELLHVAIDWSDQLTEL